MNENLTNPSKLCAQYRIGKDRMEQILAPLEPVLVMPFGRGTMRLYDPAKAKARIETALAEEAAQRTPAKAPSAVEVPQVDLLPVITQLNTLTQLVANLTTEVSRLRADALGRLDVIALKAELDAIVTDGKDDAHDVLDGTVKQPAVEQLPVKTTKVEKIKVALVAVPASMANRLRQQFGDVFDFKFLDSKDAVGNSFSQRVGDAQFVIGMLDFMNHGIGGIERNASYTYIPLKGGQSKLLDKLNELFAQVTEPA